MTNAIVNIIIIHFTCFGIIMAYMGFINYKSRKKKDE